MKAASDLAILLKQDKQIKVFEILLQSCTQSAGSWTAVGLLGTNRCPNSLRTLGTRLILLMLGLPLESLPQSTIYPLSLLQWKITKALSDLGIKKNSFSLSSTPFYLLSYHCCIFFCIYSR